MPWVLGLQWPDVTTTVDIGGGLSASTSSEMSLGAEEFPSEGPGPCLNMSLAVDLSVFEGLAKRAVEDAHLIPVGSGLGWFLLL